MIIDIIKQRIYSRNNSERLLIFGICIFILGSSFDHESTQYGLMLENVFETNSLVCKLREMGVWSLIEALTLVAGISGGLFILKIRHKETYGLHSLYLAVGTYRMIAGFSNLIVISQVLF